jgi:hypothetical protein
MVDDNQQLAQFGPFGPLSRLYFSHVSDGGGGRRQETHQVARGERETSAYVVAAKIGKSKRADWANSLVSERPTCLPARSRSGALATSKEARSSRRHGRKTSPNQAKHEPPPEWSDTDLVALL